MIATVLIAWVVLTYATALAYWVRRFGSDNSTVFEGAIWSLLVAALFVPMTLGALVTLGFWLGRRVLA